MRILFGLFIVLMAIKSNLQAAEAGMPQLDHKYWASQTFWKKCAIWVTAVMFVILIFLTFDSVSKITAGTERVPEYSVINKKVFYKYSEARDILVPEICCEAPLFGKKLSNDEAADLIDLGKLTIQAKNCMNCHTLLGNGAYYAPDLTKAWLDQGWINESIRENLMVDFLLDPEANARSFGTNRKMPNLGLTEDEAKAVVAYLKWMSAIDTNGFPAWFKPIYQEEE